MSARGLSVAQASVMAQLAEGMRIKQIAADAGTTRNTVKTHLKRAMAKLGAKTPEQAAVLFDRQRRAQ